MQHPELAPRLRHRPRNETPLYAGLLCVAGFLALGTGCVVEGSDGDCGPVLSSGACSIVRAQLGPLAAPPPPDPTNRYGQGVPGGIDAQSKDEEAAYQLGRYLFFDRCMSSDKVTACVSCHDPGAAFIDSRARAVMVPVTMPGMNGGMATTVRLPAIRDVSGQDRPLSPTLVMTPPTDANGGAQVASEVDPAGVPLAYWDDSTQMWRAHVRRVQSSQGSHDPGPGGTTGFTGRNSPSLYNVAYGAGVPAPDGARVAGANWVPWDGRYDSVWSLVADVYEFGAVQRTNRAHIALRVYRQHHTLYEKMTGKAMPNLDDMGLAGRTYPWNASPVGVLASWKDCWNSTPDANKCPPDVMAPTAEVKDTINQIFVNSGKALAAFIRRLRSGNSPYDRWLKNPGDPAAMSVAAQRGLGLFIGKAECILCHDGPNFTDWRFHNLGVPVFDPEQHISGSVVPPPPAGGYPTVTDCFNEGSAPKPICPDAGRYAWQEHLSGRCDNINFCQKTDSTSCLGSAGMYNDSGDPTQCLPPSFFDRCAIPTPEACALDGVCTWSATSNRCVPRPTAGDLGAFKTPSLRNVAKSWPYMHNGALSNFGPAQDAQISPADVAADPTPHLVQVVQFYNQGGGTPVVGTRDRLLRPLSLTPSEIADVVEFLKALTDESIGGGEAGVDPDPRVDQPDPNDMNPMGLCPP